MVKLVDTPASGAGDRKVVEVRVFFWAPIQAADYTSLLLHKNPRKRVFAFWGFDHFKVLIALAKQGFTEQNVRRIVRPINGVHAADTAQMVKLVDTPASGAGDRKVVEVRVFFWAPIQTKPSLALGFVLFGPTLSCRTHRPPLCLCADPSGSSSTRCPAWIIDIDLSTTVCTHLLPDSKRWND
jgi:hypothetical protein